MINGVKAMGLRWRHSGLAQWTQVQQTWRRIWPNVATGGGDDMRRRSIARLDENAFESRNLTRQPFALFCVDTLSEKEQGECRCLRKA
jgi:hypothetical protein